MALLQPESDLTAAALEELSAKATDNRVQPDAALLAVLLDKGLFDKASGGLQAQLIRGISDNAEAPQLGIQKHGWQANSILIPALIAHLAAKGWYAQAAEVCAYHSLLHPSYRSWEIGLQRLPPYLQAHSQHSYAKLAMANFPQNWPLPVALRRLLTQLPSFAAVALQHMRENSFSELV